MLSFSRLTHAICGKLNAVYLERYFQKVVMQLFTVTVWLQVSGFYAPLPVRPLACSPSG